MGDGDVDKEPAPLSGTDIRLAEFHPRLDEGASRYGC